MGFYTDAVPTGLKTKGTRFYTDAAPTRLVLLMLWDSTQMLKKSAKYPSKNTPSRTPYKACFIGVIGFYTDAEEIRKIPKQKHPKRFYKYATPTGLKTDGSTRPL